MLLLLLLSTICLGVCCNLAEILCNRADDGKDPLAVRSKVLALELLVKHAPDKSDLNLWKRTENVLQVSVLENAGSALRSNEVDNFYSFFKIFVLPDKSNDAKLAVHICQITVLFDSIFAANCCFGARRAGSHSAQQRARGAGLVLRISFYGFHNAFGWSLYTLCRPNLILLFIYYYCYYYSKFLMQDPIFNGAAQLFAIMVECFKP